MQIAKDNVLKINLPAIKEVSHRTIWLDGGEVRADGEPERVVEDYLGHLG